MRRSKKKRKRFFLAEEGSEGGKNGCMNDMTRRLTRGTLSSTLNAHTHTFNRNNSYEAERTLVFGTFYATDTAQTS